MNPFKFLKKNNSPKTDDTRNEDTAEYDDNNEINIGTKVKIISAMLVVAVATYVALWVQEPADLKIDVIGSTSPVEEQFIDAIPTIRETGMVAAVDTSYPVLAEVSITDFTFTPANMTVKKGTTVVWTNMDPVDHTVTADTFSSSTLESGDSYTYTFDTAGEYPYGCAFHPQMTGKIIVSADDTPLSVDMPYVASEDVELPRDYDDLFPALSTVDDLDRAPEVGAGLLTVTNPQVSVTANNEQPSETLLVTFDPEELLASGDIQREASEAIAESEKITKSGPEDILYFIIFAAILYHNRRKLAGVLR